MSDLAQKTNAVLAGKVVRKDLVRKVKARANVLVYVLEYLLGKYCATDDPYAIDAGLRLVNTTLANNFVRPDEANKAQSSVKEKGRYGWEIPKMQVPFFIEHYGFVVDYLAEALRELRRHNFTEIIDRHFVLGSHLNARDVVAPHVTVVRSVVA